MTNLGTDSRARLPRLLCALILAAVLAACGRAQGLPRLGASDAVLAFGDSLTYGTGASEDESYPAVLAALIGRPVIRAGVPGETSSEGLERLPGALEEHRPKLVILCLGGNDFLRQLDETQTVTNLRAMLRMLKERGVATILIGVPKPKLFAGPPEFYADLAKQFTAPYEGKILKQVLYDNALKSDQIHPNARGYRRIAERMAELLRETGAI